MRDSIYMHSTELYNGVGLGGSSIGPPTLAPFPRLRSSIRAAFDPTPLLI